MADINELQKKLDAFKADRQNELVYGPIEKFMLEDLGVEKIETGKQPGKKKGQGSKLFYSHSALLMWKMSPLFTVHRQHKKRLMIYKRNFEKKKTY